LLKAFLIVYLKGAAHLANQALLFKSAKRPRYTGTVQPYDGGKIIVRNWKNTLVACIECQAEPAR